VAAIYAGVARGTVTMLTLFWITVNGFTESLEFGVTLRTVELNKAAYTLTHQLRNNPHNG
jgi:hypothetical protein